MHARAPTAALTRLVHVIGRHEHARHTLVQVLQRGLADEPGHKPVVALDEAARYSNSEIRSQWPEPGSTVFVHAAERGPRHAALASGDWLVSCHIERP